MAVFFPLQARLFRTGKNRIYLFFRFTAMKYASYSDQKTRSDRKLYANFLVILVSFCRKQLVFFFLKFLLLFLRLILSNLWDSYILWWKSNGRLPRHFICVLNGKQKKFCRLLVTLIMRLRHIPSPLGHHNMLSQRYWLFY